MEKYDYLKNVINDVRAFIEENEIEVTASNIEDVRERLHDRLWANDSVTGNASGSYTCNFWLAEEYLCHNWDLLAEALEEFGSTDIDVLEKGAEWCDVTIRCYLLGAAIEEVLDSMELEESEEIEC